MIRKVRGQMCGWNCGERYSAVSEDAMSFDGRKFFDDYDTRDERMSSGWNRLITKLHRELHFGWTTIFGHFCDVFFHR